MKVVTLHPGAFEQACAELAQRCFDWRPDLLIGIRAGGYVVAEAMRSALGDEAPPLLPITRQRASTHAKQNSRFIRRVLPHLPYSVTDRLRVLEHRALTSRHKPAEPPHWEPDHQELVQLQAQLHGTPSHRILVIDDAVDTGTTLCAVMDIVHQLAPAAQLRSAAIVQSTPQPAIVPNYVLHTRQLCRFPWSHDFKPTRPAL